MPIPTRGFPDDFSDQFLDHNSGKRTSELEDTQPIKRVIASELTPPPETNPEKIKFNWVAFIVMLISIGAALLVGVLIPGILDEYIAMFIITTLYGFAQAHGFKVNKITKK